MSETHLGLCATCCVTLMIWMVAIPVFDIMGMSWISSWEGPLKAETLTYADFLLQMEAVNQNTQTPVAGPRQLNEAPFDATAFGNNVYDALNQADDGVTTEDFADAKGANITWIQAEYIMKFVDTDQDAYVSREEMVEGVSHDHWYQIRPITTTTIPPETTATITPAIPPETTATITPATATAKTTAKQVVDHLSMNVAGLDCDGVMKDSGVRDGVAQGVKDSIAEQAGPAVSANDVAVTLSCSTNDSLAEVPERKLSSRGIIVAQATITTPATVTIPTLPHTALVSSIVKKIKEVPHIENVITGDVAVSNIVQVKHGQTPAVKKDGTFVEVMAALLLGFLDDAKAWKGTLHKACENMDITGGGNVTLDEFTGVASLLQPPRTLAQAKDIFKIMDANHDGFINAGECYMSVSQFRAKVNTVSAGDPETFFRNLDLDHNGELSPVEFEAVAPFVDITKQQTVLLLVAMDENHDGNLQFSELVLAATTTINSLNSPLTPDEVKGYDGVAAMVQGHSEVFLTLPRTATVPQDFGRQISEEVRPIFKSTFESAFGLNVTIESVQTAVEEASAAVESAHQRKTTVAWSAVTQDGGATMIHIEKDGFHERFQVGMAQYAFAPWLRNATCVVWTRMSLSFYGIDAASLPRGTQLVQHTGEKPGVASEDGSAPFTPNVATGRRANEF